MSSLVDLANNPFSLLLDMASRDGKVDIIPMHISAVRDAHPDTEGCEVLVQGQWIPVSQSRAEVMVAFKLLTAEQLGGLQKFMENQL